MKRKLVIEGLQAVSINAAYYNDRKLGYKADVRNWLAQVAHQLGQNGNKQAVDDIKNHFDVNKHCFHVMLTFHTPKFFNKTGLISAQSLDLSNVEKVLIDALFLDSHTNTLGIDDKYITRMVSEKKFGDEYRIDISIHVKECKRPKVS